MAQPYTYTPLNQIKVAGSTSYGYDAADNLTTLTNGSTQFFDPASQLCWSASSTGSSCSSAPSGATTYTYDFARQSNQGHDRVDINHVRIRRGQPAEFVYQLDGIRDVQVRR